MAIKLAQYIKHKILHRLQTYRHEKRIKNGENLGQADDTWLEVGEATKEPQAKKHTTAAVPQAKLTAELPTGIGGKAARGNNARGKADNSTPAPSKPRRKGRISPVSMEDDKKGDDGDDEDGFNPFSY